MSEDGTLLAAIEAMHAELREMRKEALDGRVVRDALEQRRRSDAERSARARAKSRDNHATASRDNHVTRGVLKALDLDLDLDPEKQKQVLTTAKSRDRHATSRDSGPTREAFAVAYEKRHGVAPVWNATTNTQLARFVKRIGVEESPMVAEFYVSHNSSWYTQKLHPVGLMLTDAEKLHTEWKRGRQMTPTEARQQEKTQANLDGWADQLPEARKRNGVV